MPYTDFEVAVIALQAICTLVVIAWLTLSNRS